MTEVCTEGGSFVVLPSAEVRRLAEEHLTKCRSARELDWRRAAEYRRSEIERSWSHRIFRSTVPSVDEIVRSMKADQLCCLFYDRDQYGEDRARYLLAAARYAETVNVSARDLYMITP